MRTGSTQSCIAEVESGGRSAFWRLNKADGRYVPAILYERHYFSNATQHKYDKDHPDISWPTGYRKKNQLGKADVRMSSGKVDTDDIYSDYASAYLRLINAYRLNSDAALKSCSWGKFQIMGDNHVLCGERDIDRFIAKMCASEAAQIGLLAEFIRRKPRSWKDPKNKALGKSPSGMPSANQKLGGHRLQLQRAQLQNIRLRHQTEKRL